MSDEAELSATDRDALERAMERASEDDPEASRSISVRLKEDGWFEAARFASYGLQIRMLHLYPWQEPPAVCDEDDPNERDKVGQALLRRMLAAGLSRYEPDPLAALAAAKEKQPDEK